MWHDEAPESLDIDVVRDHCGVGRGAECCAFVGMGHEGWACLKHTNFAPVIRMRLLEGTMNAKSDNCPGVEPSA